MYINIVLERDIPPKIRRHNSIGNNINMCTFKLFLLNIYSQQINKYFFLSSGPIHIFFFLFPFYFAINFRTVHPLSHFKSLLNHVWFYYATQLFINIPCELQLIIPIFIRFIYNNLFSSVRCYYATLKL